jgi:tetratricopeptide (TPR) repeat protein
MGGDKSSVFAYADELDDWMRNRGRKAANEPAGVANPALVSPSFIHSEPVQRNGSLDYTLIPDASRTRSADLVAIADRMWESLSSQSLPKITRLYREAAELDPGNAQGLAGLTFALISEGLWGLVRPPVAYAEAKAALRLTMEIDSKLPMARCAEAWLSMISNRHWQGARLYFDGELKRQPPFRRSLIGRAALHIAEGYPKEASVLLLGAAQRSPLSSSATTWLCLSKYLAGEFADALYHSAQYCASGRHGPVEAAVEAFASIQFEDPGVQIERIEALLAQTPHIDVLRGALGYAYASAGQTRRANELLAAMTDTRSTQQAHEPYAIALPLIGLNQIPKAVGLLERSYRDGSIWSLGFRSDPILATLRDDPHFRHLMGKLSYPGNHDGESHLGLAG